MLRRIFNKIKLVGEIESLSKKESNDFVFGGKVRSLLDYFKETGEIKKDPASRKL